MVPFHEPLFNIGEKEKVIVRKYKKYARGFDISSFSFFLHCPMMGGKPYCCCCCEAAAAAAAAAAATCCCCCCCILARNPPSEFNVEEDPPNPTWGLTPPTAPPAPQSDSEPEPEPARRSLPPPPPMPPWEPADSFPGNGEKKDDL